LLVIGYRLLVGLRFLVAGWFLFALAACSRAPETSALDRLHPCTHDEGPTDAYCGTLKVFENRQTRQGRTLDLRIVVLPSLSAEAKPDPLFFLAGGPGQGAAEMARQLRDVFHRIEENRDIVLVDQRGTGKSHPLNCESDVDSLAAINESDEEALTRLRGCLAGYDADTTLYTTSIAMDDLDDVRAFLGYDSINVYGGSYGTRAALVYLRQHEDRVRAVVLDAVAPPNMRMPLFAARDGQRALDSLIADCDADQQCRTLYPNLAERLRTLLARLERQPARVTLTHPRTGAMETVSIDARFVSGVIFGALYAPLAASLIPELVARAERNDFQGLVALGLINEPAAENMSTGMQLSVLCAEDAHRSTPEEVEREAAGTVFGTHLMSLVRACSFWPAGDVAEPFYTPVMSAKPVLVFSGALDPITPPSWGESVTSTLSNSRHIVVPGSGHISLGSGCVMRLMTQFIETADPKSLDPSCLAGLKRPPFFVSPAGPDPGTRKPS
jgi:pimeloyl-ACP methyl ester carboxylesterase